MEYRTYKKLGSGEWGIASPTACQPGEKVVVTKRNGDTKVEAIGTFDCQSGDWFLYTIMPKAPAREAAVVGDLGGVLALFDRARKHLKFPAIVLGVPDLGGGIRITVAGERAKVPGSLTVTSADRGGDGARVWYGRVLLDGSYFAASACTPRERTEIEARLRAFSADPAKVAGEHGRLTGCCCFCNRKLDDERSTAVGYGPVCADHFGLPWGARPAEFAERPSGKSPAERRKIMDALTEVSGLAEVDAIEREMAQMEAEGDRAQTIRDERRKHEARKRMERNILGGG